jgi:hypothetical protein
MKKARNSPGYLYPNPWWLCRVKAVRVCCRVVVAFMFKQTIGSGASKIEMTRDAIDFRGLDQLSPFRFASVCIDSLGRLNAARASRLPPDDAGSEGS